MNTFLHEVMRLIGRPLETKPELAPSKPRRPAITEEEWTSAPADAIGLFLDFDGVMHRAENGSFERLPQLEGLLRSFPRLRIILSTNHRLYARRDALLACFPRASHSLVIGVTPYLPDSGAFQRERECIAFAKANGLSRFVAVDDDTREFSEGCSFLVLTKRYAGLDDDAVNRVAAHLRKIEAQPGRYFDWRADQQGEQHLS